MYFVEIDLNGEHIYKLPGPSWSYRIVLSVHLSNPIRHHLAFDPFAQKFNHTLSSTFSAHIHQMGGHVKFDRDVRLKDIRKGCWEAFDKRAENMDRSLSTHPLQGISYQARSLFSYIFAGRRESVYVVKTIRPDLLERKEKGLTRVAARYLRPWGERSG
jgi:hypothetical protein